MKAYLTAAALLLAATVMPASAMQIAPAPTGPSFITDVAGFCGIGWYRGPGGYCHPKGYYPYHYGHYHCWWRAGVRYCR